MNAKERKFRNLDFEKNINVKFQNFEISKQGEILKSRKYKGPLMFFKFFTKQMGLKILFEEDKKNFNFIPEI